MPAPQSNAMQMPRAAIVDFLKNNNELKSTQHKYKKVQISADLYNI